MVRRIDPEDLRTAWRALRGHTGEGWRTIPLGSIGPVRILAGRRLPHDEEAVIVGLSGAQLPPADQLPRGRGFEVERLSLEGLPQDCTWIGLSRQPVGSIELFAMMVGDLLDTLQQEHSHRGSTSLVAVFLSRIRAWQDFMQQGDDGILSAEAEVGLAGELVLLEALLSAGMAPQVVLAAWQGPIGGLHDFALPPGAIEVKASVATAGFPASIGSLEQLDDGKVTPLFLAAVRLALSATGLRLPEIVCRMRSRLTNELQAAAVFESRLLHAGYSDRFADRYIRRFAEAGIRLFRVDESFPRLVPSSVSPAIRRARYEIDIDMADIEALALRPVLGLLGAI